MVSEFASKPRLTRAVLLFLFLFAIAFTSQSQAEGLRVGWKPPFLPITITADADGIDISGDKSIATPVGVFYAGYSHDLLKKQNDNLQLVIRDKEGEHVYEIRNNKKLSVVTDGITLIEAENNVVVVDVTKGKTVKIQFSTKGEEASATTSSADDTLRTSNRESSSSTSGQYRINGDGTVTDTKTKLMWKRCSEGQSGDSCSGEASEYKWDDAMSKFGSDVSFAGHSDWRMPTKEELRSLVYCSNGTPQEEAWDYECDGKDDKAGEYKGPTINQTAFPNTAQWHWSSTEKDASAAWYVFFLSGNGNWLVHGNGLAVRLVRSGQ
ncbi:DUF1566 domain-containing protein [Thiothrix unzii]|uniref:DUF1566 domain-containing protein n=1 Tax=Thiothrix unzii TaxID=111769 RepID=A0A975F616_9GAMM|nr:DUF1566 domain-containing protein [Thiothrix unzii]QTR51971.1 DUF1566 domain-containing protein [Thiothrix unzii]